MVMAEGESCAALTHPRMCARCPVVRVVPGDAQPLTLDLKGRIYQGVPVRGHTLRVVDCVAATDKTPGQARVTQMINTAFHMHCVESDMANDAFLDVGG